MHAARRASVPVAPRIATTLGHAFGRPLVDLAAIATLVLMAAVSGPNLVFGHVNPAFASFFGDRPLIGRPLAEAVPEAQTWMMLLLGTTVILLRKRRRN